MPSLEIWTYAYFLGVGFLLTWLLMPVGMRVARQIGLVDRPADRKIHDRPMPLGGGLVVFAVVGLLLVAHGAIYPTLVEDLASGLPDPLTKFGRDFTGTVLRIIVLVVSGAMVFMLGAVDDRKKLGVGTRLTVQIIAATMAIFGGVQPVYTDVPYLLGGGLSVFWVVTAMNAYNMIDGLDGLAAGVGLIACTILGISLHLSSQPQGVVVMAVMAGALIGFLRYNYHPAKVFMGSSGSLTMGHVLGCMTLYLGALRGAAVDVQALCVPFLIMAMPLYDLVSVVYLRRVHKMPLMEGDNNHFHYRLLKVGFSHRQAVHFIWLLALIAGLPAIPLLELERGMSLTLLGQVVAMCLALIVIERAYNRQRIEVAEQVRKDTERKLTGIKP